MTKKINSILLWVFISFYLFYFSFLSIMKFKSFDYTDFDLAIFSLVMWNILHGSIYNSILGIPFLGNHMHPIMFLITPIYFVFNHPVSLLLLQTAALGMSALPLYKLAGRLLDENWALIISIIYLFYPPLGYTNLFEFHPTSFATFFLCMTLYYFETESFSKFLIFMVLSMLCQENIPLVIIMFGIMSVFRRRRLKWILVPILSGAVYFFIAVSFIAHFNNNTIQFFKIYSRLGNSPLKIIATLLTNPMVILKTILRKECVRYLAVLFLPVSFVSLFRPLSLLPAVPLFLQHMLSDRGTELSIGYHYTAELIPFIFVSFMYGVKSAVKKTSPGRTPYFSKIFLLSILFFNNALFGPHFNMLAWILHSDSRNQGIAVKERFLSKVPKDASVVATFEFLSHLANRSRLYSLHHVYTGVYTLSTKHYELPNDVEYALIDFNDATFPLFYKSGNYKNLQHMVSRDDLHIQDFVETIVLFKKNAPTGLSLYEIINDPSQEIENTMGVTIENTIELIGYSLNKGSEAGVLDMVLYWRCLKTTSKDINIFFDFIDIRDTLIMRKSHPIGYRIYPTNSWESGQILKERVRLMVPSACMKKNYKIKMGFYDYSNGKLCKTDRETDSAGRIVLREIR